MDKEIIWNIERTSPNILLGEVRIEKESKRLYLQMDYPQDFQYGLFLAVFDPKGRMRLQKLLGYGRQDLCIGEDGMHTTVGGMPGMIPTGSWRIVLGIFTEYLKRYAGTMPVEVRMTVTDQEAAVTQPIGPILWTHGMTAQGIALDAYDWMTQRKKSAGWYKGDFHTHTRLSDGKHTVKEAMTLAEQMGLDFYVPTEHNLIHTGWVSTPVMAIPGVEITTELGHCNLFGITEYPSKIPDILQHMGQPQMETDLLDQIQEAVEHHWIVSVNHPFLHIWKWLCGSLSLEQIGAMEIINDPTYDYAREANDKTIRFLDLLHMDGYRITGIGGSDAHNLLEERYTDADMPSVAGDPATFVYAEGMSPQSILQGVRKGNVCVTRYCRMEMQAEEIPGGSMCPQNGTDGTETAAAVQPEKRAEDKKRYLPGDNLRPGSTVQIHLQLSEMQQEPELFAISYRDTEGERRLQRSKVPVKEHTQDQYVWEITYQTMQQDWQWIRFEARDKQGRFMAYTNPLYCGTGEKKWKTYQEALDYFKEVGDEQLYDKRNLI